MRTKKFVEILGQKITEQNNKIVMLENKVRKLEKQVEDKDWICSMRVHQALRKVLEEHTVKIVTELNGQEITTKMIRDKRKELAAKKQKLEWVLKETNEALEELGEEQER
jgi:uncharacterized protein YukE